MSQRPNGQELGISRDYHDSFDRFLGNTTPL